MTKLEQLRLEFQYWHTADVEQFIHLELDSLRLKFHKAKKKKKKMMMKIRRRRRSEEEEQEQEEDPKHGFKNSYGERTGK